MKKTRSGRFRFSVLLLLIKGISKICFIALGVFAEYAQRPSFCHFMSICRLTAKKEIHNQYPRLDKIREKYISCYCLFNTYFKAEPNYSEEQSIPLRILWHEKPQIKMKFVLCWILPV